MPAPSSVGSITGYSGSGLGSPAINSPNISPANRQRGNRARSAAQARTRLRPNASRGSRARHGAPPNTRASRQPIQPRAGNPAAPAAPAVPTAAAPAAAAARAGAPAAGATIWTATPASAPLATAISVPVAAAAGLAIGNAIYEDVLGRPFGPSLGDLFFGRESPERDGSTQPYSGPGGDETLVGQLGVMYRFGWAVKLLYANGQIRTDTTDRSRHGFLGTAIGPLTAPINLGDQGWQIFSNGQSLGAFLYTEATDILLVNDFFVERVDGLPDVPVTRPGAPQPATPSQPYTPRTLPTPTQPIPTDPFPRSPAQPLAPSPEPEPAPDTSPAPYPGFRPPANDSPFPLPFPPLIPARVPNPAPTPTPTRAIPIIPTIPPPSTRQGPQCPCSGVTVAHIGQQVAPTTQAQQLTNNALAGQALSLAAILARLQQIQQFAETAWKNTKLDKLINLLTLVSVIHNAGMLSRNVGETMGELASNMLAVVGIKDETGSALDINELVGSSVRNFIQSVVGVEVYNDVSDAWKRSSRIVQSAAMIVYTIRGLHDTSKDVLEWSAENIGKIGNALKRWGVVGDRAYPWMSERVRAQDKYRRKFQRVTEGLESLEDTGDSLSQVTGEIREIQEEYVL